MLSSDDVRARFASLRQATIARGMRAPHQPLLLLYLLGRLQQRGTTQVKYVELEPRVSELIDEFGPPARSQHRAELPFVHLSRELWVPSIKGHSQKHAQLKREDAGGHLLPEVEHALLAQPRLLKDLARKLLASNFPETYFEPICSAVGLTLDDDARDVLRTGEAVVRPRSVEFRETVLLAYGYACAMCGFDGRLARDPVGIEAAHIQWHALGGPDDVTNGLALCDLHHKLFDRGVLGIDGRGAIAVSKSFNAGSDAAKRWVWDLHGAPLRPSSPNFERIEARHIEWHRIQVFRAA